MDLEWLTSLGRHVQRLSYHQQEAPGSTLHLDQTPVCILRLLYTQHHVPAQCMHANVTEGINYGSM